ncbi:hypothetical protein [Methylobacterium crusticola]|uniref:hypothetical protein n=1 Tax=Methylobacterium crusticola TaxID=1697972 RepID=UPI000FFCA54D|nr:hypothetical protein [Methylobacterium crusticola]
MVTPKTGRPRGRPKKFPLHDPDRYWIAYAFALQASGYSERAAFDLAAAQVYGEVGKIEKIQFGDKTGWTRVEFPKVAGSATTVPGKASTLRRKANVARTGEEAYWLVLISRAWLQAMRSKDRARNRAEMLAIGSHLGEEAFIAGCLIPFLAAATALPDYSPRD